MPESFAASLRLAPDAMTRPCAPDQFNFATTDDLEPFRGVLGQERAVDALQPGDALLIAGKGHESGQVVGTDVYPFDDVEQASVAVAALDGVI